MHGNPHQRGGAACTPPDAINIAIDLAIIAALAYLLFTSQKGR